VTLDWLVKLIDVSKNPEVLKGAKSEKEAFKDFISHWDKNHPEKHILF